MKGHLYGFTASLVLLASTENASAQWFQNKNFIDNSGNGAGNLIQALNRGQPPLPYGFPVGYPAFPAQPIGIAAPGYPFPGSFAQSNQIFDSGNGIGNTIIARNRAGCFPAASFPFGPGGFGVNINVIANSGNGTGNVIQGVNRSFGRNGVNVNVITNSGNGIGNLIKAINR